MKKRGMELELAIEHLQIADFLLKEKKARKLCQMEGKMIINETMHSLYWICDKSWKKVRNRLKKVKLDHLLDLYLERKR